MSSFPASPEAPPPAIRAPRRRFWMAARYLLAAVLCGLVTLVALPMLQFLDLPNIMLLFLLGVVVIAWQLGRGPALLASFLSVALFDYFFVPPRLTFAVADNQYIVTFGVLLAVALIIGQLTANLRHERNASLRREQWLHALYEMGRDLSGALQVEQVVEIGTRYIGASFASRVAVLLADDAGKVQLAGDAPLRVDGEAAQFAFDYNAPMGGDAAGAVLYLPLRAPMRTRGVLAFELDAAGPPGPEARRQLDSFVALIATALERIHYIEVAQNALVKVESERLRSSVLAALSHDLRTPLTALVGTAESLLRTRPSLGTPQEELALSMRDQAYRMNSLVENLLDMARLQAGQLKLNLRWQPLEEVIGSALRAREMLLAGREVKLSLSPDLPALQFDALLMERVFVNLLENAAKYTPAGSAIEVSARCAGIEAIICISDSGPGLARGNEREIFEQFARGDRSPPVGGSGLGLAICRSIVQAHRGRIWAENGRDGYGASFCFTLPLGTPPRLSDMEGESGE